MIRLARACGTILRVALADAVAYRAEMLVWMLTSTMPLVALALWSEVAAEAPVGGFAQGDLVAYFLAVLVVRQLTSSWVVWEMLQDVRSGSMVRRLMKPFPPLLAYALESLAALPLRVAFALPVAALALAARGVRVAPDAATLAAFVSSLALAWVITFSMTAAVGALAFFIQSSAGIFDLWFGGFMLFSGYVIPVSLLPPWAAAVGRALPYRWLLAFPVEMILGRLSRAEIASGLATQAAWAVAMTALAVATFRSGLRRYAAFGG